MTDTRTTNNFRRVRRTQLRQGARQGASMVLQLLAACAAGATVVVSFVFVALGARVSFSRGTLPDFDDERAKSQAEPQTVASSRRTGAPLRFLSQNVWCHYIVPAPGRMRRLKALADHIEQSTVPFDVVMLQELFLMRVGLFVFSREMEYFARRMAAIGLRHATDPYTSLPSLGDFLRLRVQNSGVVTFSRFPIRSQHHEPFQKTDEKTNTKVPTSAGGTPATVRLVNTHLDSRKWKTKEKQINQIGAVMARLASEMPCTATVATGDWNVDHGTPAYTHLAGTLASVGCSVDTAAALRIGTMRRVSVKKPMLYAHQVLGRAAPFVPQASEGVCILDHTFVSVPAPTATVADWTVGDTQEPVADHRGVVSSVHIGGAPSASTVADSDVPRPTAA